MSEFQSPQIIEGAKDLKDLHKVRKNIPDKLMFYEKEIKNVKGRPWLVNFGNIISKFAGFAAVSLFSASVKRCVKLKKVE